MENKETLVFLKEKLKQNQIKLTSTRMAILDVFTKNNRQMDAEQIYMLAHRKDSTIGLATVYRNLKLLTGLGLVAKSSGDGGKSVYFLAGKLGSRKGEKAKQPAARPKSQRAEGKDIYRIENQLNEALKDLNKLKLEKEIALEDVIKDFGRLDRILQAYELEQNNLIQILLDIQEEYRWLPKHALLYVSSKLDIPLTRVYGIASFYKFLNLEPQGRHSILVCTGTACHVRGSMNLLQNIVDVLGVKPGDTTQDLKFTLDTVNCLGCCALGPVVMIDNEYYSNPSGKDLKKILKSLD
ncbi:MAG: NAD(P)H-dependent oxidoreductase subunit E [Actinomycetota bacterium]